MINDIRQFKRFETLLIVDIHPHSEPSNFYFGITKNISFEGFMFESQNFNLKPGDILEFKLKHPKKDLSLTAVGEIIWVEKTKYEYLAGVKYRIINEEIKRKILALVSAEQDIATEQDSSKEDFEIIRSETVVNSVLKEQPDTRDQSKISEAISRSVHDIESEKPPTISSSGLTGAPAAGRSPDNRRKDETERTPSILDVWDHDNNIPKQQRKSWVRKTIVLIATITVVASLSFGVWKYRGNIDLSVPSARNDTAVEDIEYDPEINMLALQDLHDSSLPDISEKNSSLSELEEIVETEPPREEQSPSLNVENTLITLNNDSEQKSRPTNISPQIDKQEPRYRDTDTSTITEDDNELIPVLSQPAKKTDTDQTAKTESIISESEEPKIERLTKAFQQSEPEKLIDRIPKEREAEISTQSDDVMIADQKDNIVDYEETIDSIPGNVKNAQATQIPEKTDQEPEGEKQGEDVNRARIIKYSAEPRKYFLQVGAWKNPDLAKKTLSQLHRDYAEAYSFLKDNFQIIIIPNILTKERANALSKEIENKFDLKPLIAVMHKETEISSEMASTEISEMKIVDRDSTSTDLKANSQEFYAGKVAEPVTKAKPANTNEIKIALVIKKSYEDLFDDNSNNWDIFDLEEASARIENGFYQIENKKDEGKLIILHYHKFPHNSYFEIETSIKSTSIADNNFYGFVFGARDALDNYSFQINNNGRYSVTKNHGSSSQELTGGQINRLPSGNTSLVSLKIAKLDNNMFFYINDNYVTKISNLTFFGNKIGFVLEGSSVIAIDRTRSYIKTKKQVH